VRAYSWPALRRNDMGLNLARRFSVAERPTSAPAGWTVSTRARGAKKEARPGRPRPSSLCLTARCMCLLGDRIGS